MAGSTNDGRDDAARDDAGASGAGSLRGAMRQFDDAWWRDHYGGLDGVQADRGYEHYEPAFRYGWESAHRHTGRTWDEVEDEITRGWEERRGNTNAVWEEARAAIRHAFERGMRTFGDG